MGSSSQPRPRSLRRLAWRLALSGTPWLGLGCAGPAGGMVAAGLDAPAPVEVVQPAPAPAPELVQASHAEAGAKPVEPARELPITLDTVLRLAEGQNAQVGVARERLNESLLRSQMACGCWLPKVFAGLPFDLEVLYPELDGNFPNHPADPIQPDAPVTSTRMVPPER